MDNLFKLSFDDSGFQKIFLNFEKTLDRHEQMILELQKLLNTKISKKDLDSAIEDLKHELTHDFDNKLKQLENKLNDKIDAIENDFENKFHDQFKRLENIQEMSDKISELESEITKLKDTVNQNAQSIQDISDKTKENSSKIDGDHQHIQAIASAYSSINHTTATLDDTLPKTMSDTSNYLIVTLKQLLNGNAQLSRDLQTQSTKLNTPRITTCDNGTKIDLTTLTLRPSFSPSWKEDPMLPPLIKFGEIEDSVDYMYECLPKLQGYLSAMHDKVVDNSEQLSNLLNKDELDKNLEKFRQSIKDVKKELEELRRSLNRGLTRADVEQMISESIGVNEQGGSIGTLKCIACGRELTQVTGAMTENEAVRRLGKPINSIAMYSTQGYNYMGQLYSSPDLEKPDRIVESPRSMRPRGTISVRKSFRGNKSPSDDNN